MRLHRYGLLLGVLTVAGLADETAAQTLRQQPAALSTVPTGATAANPYWQHLVLDLSRTVAPGNVVTIPLPEEVEIADIDGDGSVEDEISLAGAAGQETGYGSVAGSTPTRIRLVSTRGGTPGPVHVQFPITTPSSPSAARAIYGPVSFTHGGERTIPAGTLSLSFVAGDQLHLAAYSQLFVDGTADTTTAARGHAYPEVAAAIFAGNLPDLAHDDAGTLESNSLPRTQGAFGDGDDTNDAVYRFWWSTTDSLTRVDSTTAAAAIDVATGAAATAAEADSVVISFDVSAMAVGTYYLYTTSDLTGSHPLVRSRGVTLRHDPTVLSVGTFLSGDPDWIDSGRLLDFDTGVAGTPAQARDALVIEVSAVDLDDSATVRVFYSTSGTLDTSVVTTSGSAPARAITGLTGASHVDSTVTLKEGVDSTLTWRVAPDDRNVVAAGDYFLYAVITDGTTLALARSDTVYRVRHSPRLTFDVRVDTVVATGGSRAARFHTITWNQDAGFDGDIDRDDTARIDLYYSDDPGFSIPGGGEDIETAAADPARDTHLIADSLSAADGPRDSNQYAWDLWTYANPDDGAVPVEGRTYYLYGVIKGGGVTRLVRWEDGTGQARTIQFRHDPYILPQAPMGPLAVDGRRSFEVAWEGGDVDDAARAWVVLLPSAIATTQEATTTWGQLQEATPAGRLWIATSADGSLASGAPLNEDTTSRLDVRPARLTLASDGSASPLGDGEYHAYVLLDPSAAATPAASSLAVRMPGRITVGGLETGAAGLVRPAIEILPARRVMESWRDTTTFAIHPHSDGRRVDVVSVFLSVDTLLVTVVDQDSVTPGVQPFAVSDAWTGQILFDSVAVSSDSSLAGRWVMDLVYFEQGGVVFDGTQALATISLASRNRQGTASLRVDNLEQRRSAFYRSGLEVGSLAPETSALIDFLPRGTASGRVQLQGRTDHTEEVTLMLRERNSFTPISDSLFQATNDVNSSKAGVQDSLDANGVFHLLQIPTGSYHLAVHVDRYLDGQVTRLQVHPGDEITDLEPMVLRDGQSQAPFLLGGDVTGWVDTAGASHPDNQIDQLDVDFVTTYFGLRTTPAHAGALADVNGDSLVWVEDLNMVAANFARRGVEPSYRPAAGQGPAVWLRRERTPAGMMRVEVRGEHLTDTRAFGLRLVYDPRQWRLQGHLPGAWADPGGAVHAARLGPGRVDLGTALLGAPAPAAAGILSELLFESRVADARSEGIRLVAADLIDVGDRAQRVRWMPGVRPGSFALSQNYPNPFNPSTALRLDLPEASDVEFVIYSAAGQVIRHLVRSRLPGGAHLLPWDGRDDAGRQVASGTYIARVRARGWRAERKMLLLR